MKGVALLECAIVICLISMTCFAVVANLGYQTGKTFCEPVQAMSDEGTIISGVNNFGKCKWEDGGMTKNFMVQKLF